jgi:hypothetical protein
MRNKSSNESPFRAGYQKSKTYKKIEYIKKTKYAYFSVSIMIIYYYRRAKQNANNSSVI